ncbi:ribonuclease H-like domain-containing protein [Tanacetum coccineum]
MIQRHRSDLAYNGGPERRTTTATSRFRIMVLIEGFVCIDLKVLGLGLVFELFKVVVVDVEDGCGMKEDENDYGLHDSSGASPCDSTGDLYPVTQPSPIPHAFLTSQHTWHQRLGHPGSEVLHCLVSRNLISCNKEKPHVLCHACHLGKPLRLPFVSSNTSVTSRFDIVHSNVWTSPIPSLSGISVKRDSSRMFLSQRKYATEILERAGMVSCNSSRTPVDIESKLGDDGDPVSDPTYQSLAGSLQYLTFTRLDIFYAVQQVCLYMHDPREPHFSTLKRILSVEAEYRVVANVVAETCWLRNLLRELHTPLSSATLVYWDNLVNPERILQQIASESILITGETVEIVKDCLRKMITVSERKDELVRLQQHRLERRTDFTKENLLKANNNQLEILVSIKRTWVGCDTRSHWCHAACGVEKSLIKTGPSLKAAAGSRARLRKELECVWRMFRGSSDYKGKELHLKVGGRAGPMCALHDPSQDDTKPPMINGSNIMIKDEWSVKSTKKDNFDNVESLMKIKEAEARRYQNKGDEARKEAEVKNILTQKVVFNVIENSHIEYYKMKVRMQAKIAGLLQRMGNTKK